MSDDAAAFIENYLTACTCGRYLELLDPLTAACIYAHFLNPDDSERSEMANRAIAHNVIRFADKSGQVSKSRYATIFKIVLGTTSCNQLLWRASQTDYFNKSTRPTS